MMRRSVTAFALLVLASQLAAANGVVRTPSTTWVTDGTVVDIASQGTTVYLAGSFTRIGPKTGPFAILDRSTGEPDLTVARVAGGTVNAVAADGAGGFIIAGNFTHVGGLERAGLARLRSDGSVDPAFSVATFNYFTHMTVSGGRIFGFGYRLNPDGTVTGAALMAFDRASGARLPWTPAVNLTSMSGVHRGPDGSVVAFGVAGSGTALLYRFDGTTGATLWTVTDGGSAAVVEGSTAYAFGGGGIMRVDLVTGTTTRIVSITPCPFRTCPFLPVASLAVRGGTLYATGNWEAIGGVRRSGAVAIDLSNGSVLPWAPPQFADRDLVGPVWTDGERMLLGYAPRSAPFSRTIVAVDPTSGAATAFEAHLLGGGLGAPSLLVEPGRLLAAGSFAGAGGLPRAGLAAVSWPTGEPLSWTADPRTVPTAMVVTGNRMFVAGYVSGQGTRIVELDVATGARTSWVATPDQYVHLLEVAGNRLFAGGAFTAIDGVARSFLASFNIAPATPVLDNWAPSIELLAPAARVDDLQVVQNVVLISGNFVAVPGQPRIAVAAVDAVTGARLPWAPDFAVRGQGEIFFFDLSPGRLWVSGLFASVNGQPRPGLAAFDFTGALLPVVGPEPPAGSNGFELRATVFGDRLYIGRGYSVDLATGRRTSWAPDLEGATLGGRWSVAPGLGLVLQNSRSGFAFYPRVDPPAAVAGLSAVVSGNRVDLSWPAVAGATSYILEAGSARGRADLATLEITATSYSATAPDGVYYVRVRANGDGGVSAPSNELTIALGAGACVAAPAAPSALSVTVSGSFVTLTWNAPVGGGPVARYVVEAGSRTGGSDVATLDVGPGTRISGTVSTGPMPLFVRVRAENRCGVSAPSNEVSFSVASP